MTCWRCKNDIPDGSKTCPICNSVQNRKLGFRTGLFFWMMWACPVVSIITNTINLFFLLTSAHYLTDLSYGIFTGRFVLYTYYPELYPMDIVLLIAVFVIYGLIVATAFCAQRKQSSAPVMLLITNIAILLWSLSYLFFSLLITGIISPMLIWTVVGMLLQGAWTAASFVFWQRSYVFVY